MSLSKNTTNFESLVKNLENNPELYDLVFQVTMNEKEFSFNQRNPLIHLGTVFGILKEENSKVALHNHLYAQLIYDYMSSKLETSGVMGSSLATGITGSYIDKEGALDIEKVTRKFQVFMSQQYSKKDISFIERNGRLLFLAFIKPIINGRGFDFKEVQISEEKRLDVVISFNNQMFIVELKIWRGESYHREGIKQLTAYLDSQNQKVGYLIIYDLRKSTAKTGQYETIAADNKKIFTAWV
ncbi:MAG: hypothetical protein GY757_11470 [bacterium]|nr:hypothetical protein [bacterium]